MPYIRFTDIPTEEWNVDLPAPFNTESSVNFISIDVEADERNKNTITEIGIAILDASRVDGIPPGHNGVNWFSMIEAHHLRISEHRYVVNHEFVQGCPDSFKFGVSEFTGLNDAARRIGSIIQGTDSANKRPIVLVGHDTLVDLRFLQRVGYDFEALEQFMDEIDTKAMFQGVQFAADGRSLQHMCAELGIPGSDFHNAGNDAVFTMRAMLAMAIKQRTGGHQTISENQNHQVLPTNLEEWSDGDNDGGLAVVSTPPATSAAHQKQGPRDSFSNQQW
ncbi:hypothetical protein BX600DRAFT_210920 [Xylariales sp. PMI_506]|nr:hypothetical protein BX600DRAFT_210920 [Xylariales sp. PMI_506]